MRAPQPLLLIRPGTLPPEEKAKAELAGYCIIESLHPDAVRVLTPETTLPANDLVLTALGAMQGPESLAARGLFAQLLHRRISDKQSTQKD